ncbi:MAG: hypothetical protein Q4F30_01720 [Akkermansia sp.]|nr:hypothetical protein [Akkermansia sp.]
MYTKYGTDPTETSAGNADIANVGKFYNYFFNQNESAYVGNTIRFDGSSSNIRLNTDWSSYVWLGGVITTASEQDVTYTMGRTGNTSNFILTGTGAVNMDIDSNFTMQAGGGSIQIRKGGTWNVASGKTLTLAGIAGINISGENQTIVVTGGGNVLFTSNTTVGKGTTFNVAAGSTLALTGTVNAISDNFTEKQPTEGNGYSQVVGSATIFSGDGTVNADGVTWLFNGLDASYSNGTVSVSGEGTKYYVNETADLSTALDSKTTDVTIQNGATLNITAKTGNSNGMIKGNVLVKRGSTLQLQSNDAMGWSGNNVKVLTVEDDATVRLTHSSNETFGGQLVLNGTAAITGENARWDMFAGSSMNVAAGANASISVKDFRIRRNDATISLGDGATLTISAALSRGSEGNGTLIINGSNAESKTVLSGGGTIATLAVTKGSMDITKDLTVTQLMLSKTGAHATTVNVAAGATLNITGNTTDQGGGSFELCNWAANNVLNINGTVQSNAGITMEGNGAPTVNVNNGGLLVMNAGLIAAKREGGNAAVINVNSGATLKTAGSDADTALITVNLKDGSKLEAVYGADAASATIAKNFNLEADATVTLVTAEGKDMVINGALGNASGSISVTGPGTATLGNTAEIAGLAAGENSTIVLVGTTAVGTSVTMGTGSAIVNNGNLTMSGTANLYAADGIATVTGEKARTEGNGFGTTIMSASLSDIITGTGTTTATGVTAWTVNGNAATYDNGTLSYEGGASDKYYINDANSALSVTGDGELVKVVDNFNQFIDVAAGKHLTVSEGSQVNMVNNASNMGVWMKKDSTITVKDTSTLSVAGDVSIAAADENGAVITATGDNNQIGTNSSYHDSVIISNADITVDGNTMRSYKVEGGTVILKDAESATTTTINATLSANGQLTNLNVGRNEEAKLGNVELVLNNLTMAGGSQVTLGDNHDGALKLTKLTVTDDGAAINANLNLTGATVVLNGHQVELGCSLTLGNTTLEAELPQEDTPLVLFTGVDSLTLGTTAGTGATTVDASQYFTNLAADTYNLVYSGVDAGGEVSIQKAGSVPEPTTGTLSLLALAGLMARSRRK